MTTTKNYKLGFSGGFSQLQLKDISKAQAELYEALGVNNRTSFTQYKNGKIEPKASQAEAVEKVFEKYGITENIWEKCEATYDLRPVRNK
ncbi:MAG: hypothetical protein LBQ22_05480 [Bacteroidales bacterium]|jgi:hypothetical protein|nr:hypothetical protein [Bacteroidales bacterium]